MPRNFHVLIQLHAQIEPLRDPIDRCTSHLLFIPPSRAGAAAAVMTSLPCRVGEPHRNTHGACEIPKHARLNHNLLANARALKEREECSERCPVHSASTHRAR